MKLSRNLVLLGGALVAFASTFLLAQEQAPPAPPGPSAPTQPPSPAAPRPAPSEEPARFEAVPSVEPVAPPANEPVVSSEAPPAPVAVEIEKPERAPAVGHRRLGRRHSSDAHVSFGQEVFVAVGESVDDVVNFLGSAQVDGSVRDAVVTIGGSSVVNGAVSDDIVAVFGNVTLNGRVGGDIVAVGGGVTLGSGARVGGQVVSIGGAVKRDPGALVGGQIVDLGIFERFPDFTGLRVWFQKALLKGRLLAFDARLGWAWGIAGGFLAFYLFTALLLNGAVTRCAETLEQRPGRTILAAFLVALLSPLVTVVLAVTVIGPAVITLALIVATLFGKAAFLAWLGRRIAGPMGLRHAFPAVAIGGALLFLGYTVPFLGLVLWKLTDVLGLGMVVYALIVAMQREKTIAASAIASGRGSIASPPAGAPAAGLFPAGSGSAFVADAPVVSPGFAAPAPAGGFSSAALPPSPAVPAPPISYATLPRAGFWIRLAAAGIDLLVVGSVITILLQQGEWFPLSCAVYCVVMWALKGTTIGGIVCGLKVVRLDERPMDWSIAVVRGLGGFLSLAAGGLGFIWVAFDEERQSWHDKIAGTTVVHVPKGLALI